MSHWWRAYDEALHDPKLLKLSDETFRRWFHVCCIASKNDGVLPDYSTIALELRVTELEAIRTIKSLISSNLLDELENGKISPHNWGRRQYKSDVSTDRVKRFRERKRNVSETPPDTDTDTDTERKKVSSPKRVRTTYTEDFENFWIAYPRTPNMSKREAYDVWKGLSDVDRSAALLAVPKYVTWLAARPGHEVIHACRFLSKRRADGFNEMQQEPQRISEIG